MTKFLGFRFFSLFLMDSFIFIIFSFSFFNLSFVLCIYVLTSPLHLCPYPACLYRSCWLYYYYYYYLLSYFWIMFNCVSYLLLLYESHKTSQSDSSLLFQLFCSFRCGLRSLGSVFTWELLGRSRGGSLIGSLSTYLSLFRRLAQALFRRTAGFQVVVFPEDKFPCASAYHASAANIKLTEGSHLAQFRVYMGDCP